MPLSDDDRDMMIRTIIGEAAGEPAQGQAAVAHVIMNRVSSGQYGKTASQVVLAPNQFEPWSTRARELSSISPTSKQYQQVGLIVDSVDDGQPDFTGGATHFLNPATVRARRGGSLPSWAQGSSLTIGNHAFFAPENPNYNGPEAAIRSAIGSASAPIDPMTAIRSAIQSSDE